MRHFSSRPKSGGYAFSLWSGYSQGLADAPAGWPNELLIADDSYGKTLFAPSSGQLRIIYTRLYPLPPSVQAKLTKALESDNDRLSS